jgi:hypothetical protein
MVCIIHLTVGQELVNQVEAYILGEILSFSGFNYIVQQTGMHLHHKKPVQTGMNLLEITSSRRKL